MNLINSKIPNKRPFNLDEIRSDFPILQRLVNGKPLVYLDNAATTQKPDFVIEAIKHYYDFENANIHRGLHFLSEVATEAYETARLKVKEFLNALSASEIIFVRGTTEAINLIASTMEKAKMLKPNDEVIITNMEHHANIVPWQLICGEKGIKLRVIPINDDGELILDNFEDMFNEKTKLVSVVHISNSLGTINPVEKIISISHKYNVPVLLDGAQAVSHQNVDVQKLDCDFYTFSGHKLYGPTGIGVLYGKTKFLDSLPPYQGGGDMIRTVTFDKTTFNDLPHKFEAGTPHISGAIALAIAVNYLNAFDLNDIIQHENKLLKYATKELLKIDGLRIIGTAKDKAPVISFTIDGVHPYDVGTLLNNDGIAIRTGHHCTQPIMDRFKIPATARVSMAFYNTIYEIDILINSLRKTISILK
ncbi:MAG: cysteine desulfurase [Ignavibacteriales bacterium]|nr:cysteine desulfurase [Ignavibacteriales bacterium]